MPNKDLPPSLRPTPLNASPSLLINRPTSRLPFPKNIPAPPPSPPPPTAKVRRSRRKKR